MKKYLSIGEVSKIKGVSIKSLRYYDKLDILKPAYVNDENGYRYYAQEQLLILDFIILFVDAGVPLKEFDSYLNNDGSFNLQKGLSRGKDIARKKLNELQDSMSRMELISQSMDNYEQYKNKDFYKRKIKERKILEQIFDFDNNDLENGMKKNTELYFLSQKLGLKASYMSGIIYYFVNGESKKYTYIEVVGDCVNDKFKVIPAGEYNCKIFDITSSEEVLLQKAQSNSFIILEDVFNTAMKSEHLAVEMQYID